MAYLDTDIPMVSSGNNNNGNGMWGENSWWVIIIFALLFGWGRNDNGSGGNNGGGGTYADLQRGFDTQSITNKLNGIENGICDSTFALNNTIVNGVNGIQQSLCQGLNSVNNSIYQSGVDTRFAINDLGYRMQDCCCQTQRAIDGVNYNMATNTCNTINAINGAKAEILGFMTQQELNSLRTENQALKFQASQSAQNAFISANQNAQTAEIIRRLGLDRTVCPIPAYLVPNPNCCYPQNNSCCGCGNY